MSVYGELKRRNVFRVGIAYVITAWLLLQVIDVVAPMLGVPEWVPKSILLLLGVGFPIALLFAWAFELTPEGLKFERDVDRSQSVTHSTGRKLNFITITVLSVALVLFALDKFVWNAPSVEEDTRRSIAVLPFENMSADPDQLFFSDGISEEILNSLVRIPNISVASRTSSFNYRGADLNMPRIAEELGVFFILEGSVRKAENELRITAQLIDAAADRHLWSETYDRELKDIFEIQSEIANRIVQSIQSELGIQVRAEIAPKTLTENMSAYELYLKGYATFTQRLVPQNVLDSITYLEQAVELDPNFATAWQYLAAAYAVLPFYTLQHEDMVPYLDRSDRAADRALELDPDLSLPHGVKGGNLTVRPPYDVIGGLREYELALEKNPQDTTTQNWRAINLGMAGYFEEALAAAEKCLAVDPQYVNCLSLAGSVELLLTGKVETYNDEILLDRYASAPSPTDVDYFMARGNKIAAMYAAAHIEGLEGSPYALWVRALQRPGEDHSEAWEQYRDWALSAGVDLTQYPEILAAFGIYDQISLANVAGVWFWHPQHAGFRASDEFKKMMKKFGYFDLWKARGFPPLCRPVGNDDFACD
jgi:TolB-like protein